MPDNRLSSDQDIPIPRGTRGPDPDFEITRTLDAGIVDCEDGHLPNNHSPKG